MSEKTCGICKFFEQGESNSFCGNHLQKNKERKSYCYHSHYCNLIEEGIADSRLKYMGITRNCWDERDREEITKAHYEKIKLFNEQYRNETKNINKVRVGFFKSLFK